jgi:hypothetical protein
MPAKPALRPDEAQAQPVAVAALEPGSPVSPQANRKAKPVAASKADEWVERRQAGVAGTAPIRLGMSPDASSAMRTWIIDLAAERDLQEVMTMAFLIPPMLGWFWLFNTASKYLSAAR